uniref:Scavenger receptor class B member 1 n=2 Tax=Lutzomyia longipalpis TaxID=7200 RepID=A0A1B0CTE9_LUTLO
MHGRRNKLCAKLSSAFLRKWSRSEGIVCDSFWHRNWPFDQVDSPSDGGLGHPYEPFIRLYVYNVTNADEFLNNGSKPILDELGPYVYLGKCKLAPGFVIAFALCLLVLGVLVTFGFSALVRLVIDHQVALRPGGQSFGWWSRPPVEPFIRLYVYNVTNADEFLNNGSKPILDELGPYVYLQKWEKVDIVENDNGTLSFNAKRVYIFNEELSGGSEDDVVIVPNIPMLSATSQSKHAARFLRLAMASIMDILKIKPFVEVSVGQLLWGYEDPLLKLAKDVVPKEQKLPYEEFGLMYGKNSTSRDRVTMWSGVDDITKYGIIDKFLRLAMASIMDILKIKPFVEVSVGQLLWGYEDPLLKLAKDVVPKEQKLPYEEFGLMYGKNSTSRDRVTMWSGVDDITKYGIIDKYNGYSHLPHWSEERCNRLNGSDGSIFPPHISKNTTLYVYEKDLCRLMPLSFEKEVDTRNHVPGYRFTPSEDVFASVEKNPDNKCFCPAGPPCAPHGFFNVSACQFDSPILLSFPHFYMADQSYRLAVEGISPPEKEKHQLYIDVQPHIVEMGTALRARARIQINLAVSQVVDIKQVANFPDIVFPILWFEEGIDGLPDEVTDLMLLANTLPPKAQLGLMIALYALGAVLLVLAVTCLVRSSHRQSTLHLDSSNFLATASIDQAKKKSKMDNKERF